jgi:hypothetical protein
MKMIVCISAVCDLINSGNLVHNKLFPTISTLTEPFSETHPQDISMNAIEYLYCHFFLSRGVEKTSIGQSTDNSLRG